MTDDYTSLLGEVEAYRPPYASEDSNIDYASNFTAAEAGPQDSRLLSDILGLKYTPEESTQKPQQKAFNRDDLFGKVIQAESAGRHTDKSGKLLTSSAGAQGITQIMPATGKDPGYGIEPLKDNSEAEYLRVGRQLLDAYTKEFGGDTAKGLAAYNYGPTNVKKLIAKHGRKWKQALPKETANYLNKILGEANA